MTRTWIVGLLVALVGCGGGSNSNTPVQDVPAELAGSLCDVFDECLGTAASLFLGGADCESELTKQIADQDLGRWQASIDMGNVAYDGTRVDDCLRAIRDAGCDAITNRIPSVCEDVFDGQVEPGGACNNTTECAGDLFCQFDGSCPGRCVMRLGPTAACNEDDDCQSGLTCQSGACTAPAAAGESCEGGSEPDCELGLLCAGSADGVPGICRPLSAVFVGSEGDPCDLDTGELCREGLSCVLDGLMGIEPTFACRPPGTRDGPCKIGFPATCPSDQYCSVPGLTTGSVDGTCTHAPTDGEACTGEMFAPDCAPGHVCTDGTCHALQRIGGTCTMDSECYSELCSAGTCAAPGICAADDF